MTALQWHWPWAFALLLVPLTLWAGGLLRRQRLLDYAEPALRPWALIERGDTRPVRTLLHGLAWLLFAAALAGPRLPLDQASDAPASRQDVRVLVLLDVSDSMQATDIPPARLERARLKLHALPEHLAGESLGLALFAGTAGLAMPPSADAGVFRFALEHGTGALADVLADAPGTELATALDLAARALPAREGSGRAILLLTDGEAEAVNGNAVLAAVERLREAGIPLFILGMGTEAGAPIPDGAGGFRMLDGEVWQSRMDRARLEEMAERTGGRLVTVSDGEHDLRALAAAIRDLPSRPEPGKARAWDELFHGPLLAGLALLLAAYRPRRGSALARASASSRASSLLQALLPITALSLAFAPHDRALADADLARATAPGGEAVPEGRKLGEAYAAWARGDFVQAQLLYARQPGVAARMGEGAAAYRRGDFAHAAQSFTVAWLLAGNDASKADALYNLGNAELRGGHPERAAQAYEGVLRLRPDDEHAQANLWLARQQAEAIRMKKSRPDEPPGRRPTDMARYNEDVEADFPTEDAPSGGDLSAGGPGGGARKTGPAQALALGEADRQAAAKKLELLKDQPAPLWRAMMRGETPSRASEGLPW
ncbi:MAG: VWA domain-containing protein [Halothiobacillaceae bacterium]|nr:MAG: VWA domain-containing protein [Halothiobacillaceae bacterium]